MATPKRIWYRGASYHITARGNHRNDIFRDEADFIKLGSQASHRKGTRYHPKKSEARRKMGHFMRRDRDRSWV